MKKMSLLYKITFSAILVAVSTILSRFFAIPLYSIGIPFIKISLATSVIIFASFYLGPVFGCIVGFLEDLLGSLLVQQGGAYNPIYSISVVLGGLMPYFLYKLFNLIKIEKKFPLTLTISLTLVSTFITVFCFHPSLGYVKSGGTKFEFELWLKILLTSISWVLSILFVIGLFLIKKYAKNLKINKYYNINVIATSIFLTYILFKVPASSLVFFLMAHEAGFIYFLIIFGSRLLTSFLTAFIDLIINIVALNVSLRFNFKGSLIPKTYLEVNE